jgi:pyruvate dehydrogenase E1 component alpha subunit/2-oxoisovalerate dehydrogenase E1 component alpha subunit
MTRAEKISSKPKPKPKAAKKNGTHAAAVQVAAKPELTPQQLLEVYRAMLKIRVLDERMMTLQRQGRIGFYGTCSGQEAATIASAYALRGSDWVVPALREAGVMLMRGFSLTAYISQVFGNAGDVTKGRQMPSHQASRSVNQVSWGSCIGSQLPHAVGVAVAAKLRHDETVAMGYLGDGATSSNDFHTSMNFAAVFKAPVVFVCQNNHWSISIPTHRQTVSESIAIKAMAYGMPGVKVDGNDPEAVYTACAEAVARARSGGGPTLVECETYRMGAHSSSDDPTRYRDQAEVDEWKKRDPIERTRAKLFKLKAFTEAADQMLRAELLREINAAIKEAEAFPNPPQSTLFEDVYFEKPWHLKEQEKELQVAFTRSGGNLGGGH